MIPRDNVFYKQVYQLTRARKYRRALGLIYDRRGDGIRPRFRCDLNHAWYVVADLHLCLGQQALAARAARRALVFDPYDDWAYQIVGNSFDDRRRPHDAIRIFETACKFCPADAIFYNLGNAYFDLRRFEEAISTYRKIKNIGSSNPDDDKIYLLAQKNIESARRRLKPLKQSKSNRTVTS